MDFNFFFGETETKSRNQPLDLHFDRCRLVWLIQGKLKQRDVSTILEKYMVKTFISLEFPPSYSNFPMCHRNDKLLTVIIILIYRQS